MNAREFEHYLRDMGLSRSKAKAATADAVKAGKVKRYRPSLFTRFKNALTGKNTPRHGAGGEHHA